MRLHFAAVLILSTTLMSGCLGVPDETDGSNGNQSDATTAGTAGAIRWFNGTFDLMVDRVGPDGELSITRGGDDSCVQIRSDGIFRVLGGQATATWDAELSGPEEMELRARISPQPPPGGSVRYENPGSDDSGPGPSPLSMDLTAKMLTITEGDPIGTYYVIGIHSPFGAVEQPVRLDLAVHVEFIEGDGFEHLLTSC